MINFSRFKKKDRVLVWAHRGASGHAPENTLPAFEKAVELGADGVELDVQFTKDGQIVVIHDEKINRTSNGKGYVKDQTLEELRNFNFNKKFEECGFCKIPTLEDVYALLKPTNLTINVEFKTGMFFYELLIEKVLELTEKMGLSDRVFYSSFNHYSCMKVKELKSDAYVGFLYEDGIIDVVRYVKEHGGNALHPSLYNIQYPGVLKEAAMNGLDINAWTVNEKEPMELCCKWGINAMLTNFPDKARKISDKYAENILSD